jgi:hypothetical protein
MGEEFAHIWVREKCIQVFGGGKLKEKQFGRPRHRWKDTKMDLIQGIHKLMVRF